MAIRLVTPPPEEPITLAEAKAYLHVDHSDEDTLIDALITAAREYVEHHTNRRLVQQEWEIILDAFPDYEIQLGIVPVIEVTSVKYDDENGDEQTLSAALYTVDTASEPAWIVPDVDTNWPVTFDGVNAVRIRVQAGYDAEGSPPDYQENIPERAKLVIKMLVDHWFERKGVVTTDKNDPVIHAANSLLDQFKVYL